MEGLDKICKRLMNVTIVDKCQWKRDVTVKIQVGGLRKNIAYLK